MTGPSAWWQTAVFYQIYPRSFADSNGDGIGDLRGIIHKLDYLRDLGIEAVWLSPHFPSPLVDCGYDVADYTAVAPEYGTLDDFREMLEGMHRRGIRLVLDLVLNHTSDQHAWFQESCSSRTNPKRDWYIWRDGAADGQPPNNWNSTFGGSAWQLDEATGQYYYHFFFKEQPDLNWRNPEVRAAMWQAARFWLDLGVDGFRLDAIGTIFEDPELTPHTAALTQAEIYRLSRTAVSTQERLEAQRNWRSMFGLQHDQPGTHDVMRELRRVVDAYPDRVLIGETDRLEYYGNGTDRLHMVFNFPLMRSEQITPEVVRANQQARLAGIPAGGWPANTLGNHDTARLFSRFGDGVHDAALARLNLALMLTLRGTPFLYNGEEIGMTDLLLNDIRQFRDGLGLWAYQTEMDVLGSSPGAALAYAAREGRDKCRTPLQWTNAANAAFCPEGVAPWLPVHPNFREGVNVADQQDDPDSLLNFYRALLRARRVTPALQDGAYTPVLPPQPGCLAFTRTAANGQRVLVALNYTAQGLYLNLDLAGPPSQVIFSSRPRSTIHLRWDDLLLAPFEVLIVEVGE